MKDEIGAYYDAVAGRVADEWYPNNILMPTLRDFLSLLPDRPRILDLGCGPGYESMRLESLGAEVVGVDFSRENIRIAEERCPQCEFHELDFRRLDDRYGTYDGIFAGASFIHLTPAELPDVADRIRKVVRSNGKALTLVQDGEGIRERWREVDGRRMRWWITLYTKDVLIRRMEPFRFLREGILDPELYRQGWRCYLWEPPSG